MLEKILDFLNKKISLVLLKSKKITVGEGCQIRGNVWILGTRNVHIGNGVILNSGMKNNPIGGESQLIFRTIGNGKIIIGNHVGISNSALVAFEQIVIEDNVIMGGGCKVYDGDFHAINPKARMCKNDNNFKIESITIKKGAFIGAHCIILKGVSIGENSIIGAGSIVSKDVPANEVWAGNPAKFIKKVW